MSKEETLESKLADLQTQLDKWNAVNAFDQQEANMKARCIKNK